MSKPKGMDTIHPFGDTLKASKEDLPIPEIEELERNGSVIYKNHAYFGNDFAKSYGLDVFRLTNLSLIELFENNSAYYEVTYTVKNNNEIKTTTLEFLLSYNINSIPTQASELELIELQHSPPLPRIRQGI